MLMVEYSPPGVSMRIQHSLQFISAFIYAFNLKLVWIFRLSTVYPVSCVEYRISGHVWLVAVGVFRENHVVWWILSMWQRRRGLAVNPKTNFRSFAFVVSPHRRHLPEMNEFDELWNSSPSIFDSHAKMFSSSRKHTNTQPVIQRRIIAFHWNLIKNRTFHPRRSPPTKVTYHENQILRRRNKTRVYVRLTLWVLCKIF